MKFSNKKYLIRQKFINIQKTSKHINMHINDITISLLKLMFKWLIRVACFPKLSLFVRSGVIFLILPRNGTKSFHPDIKSRKLEL